MDKYWVTCGFFCNFAPIMSGHLIRTNQKLLDLTHPVVMAILNVTPDSFYTSVGTTDASALLCAAEHALSEGAQILDIGGYSTRPGAAEVSPEEEWERVRWAASLIRREWPDAVLSVDTFRAEVARRAVKECGVDIINDVSGGELDPLMFTTVASLGVPYILMHMRGTPATMQQHTDYTNLMSEMLDYFQRKVYQLRELGVRDIIIDPGFGFAKTLEQNYQLMANLSVLQALRLPMLVGVSHKSMIYRLLGTSAEEALNGTTALHMIALQQGASILRVHEVRPAVETIRIFEQVESSK